MELELHQLDLRYESLRRRAPEREKRLLVSLAENGQQTPIVVVAARRVVVDGYKRWVCRRLALVKELPEPIQERVRQGELVPYAAMKYLVPLARANRKACLQLVASFGKRKPSSRQMGALYAAWLSGNTKSQELLLSDPWLYLRAQEEAGRTQKVEKLPAQALLSDLGVLGAISRRACMRLRQGLWSRVLPTERDELARCAAHAHADTDCLFELFDKELRDARPEPAHSHP